MKRLAAVVVLLLGFALPAHAGAATLRLNMQDRIDSLDPAPHGPAANYLHDIVGADACAAGAASTIQRITQVDLCDKEPTANGG